MWSGLVVCLLALCAQRARAQTNELRRDNIFTTGVMLADAYQNAPDKCVFFEEVICDEIDLPAGVCNQALIDCADNCQLDGEQCANTFQLLAKQVSLAVHTVNADIIEGLRQTKNELDFDEFFDVVGLYLLNSDFEAAYTLAKVFVEVQPPSVFPPNVDALDDFGQQLNDATQLANETFEEELQPLDQFQQLFNQMPDDPEIREGFQEVLDFFEPLTGPIREMLPTDSIVLAAVNAKMAQQCDTSAALRSFEGQPEEEIAAARFFSRVHVAEIDLSTQRDYCAIPDTFNQLEAAQVSYCGTDLVLGACDAGAECESPIFDGALPAEQSCSIDNSECGAAGPGDPCICNESLCFFASGADIFVARCVDEGAQQIYERLSAVVDQIGPLAISERDGDRAYVLCSSDEQFAAAEYIYCRNAFIAFLSHTLTNATSVTTYTKLHVEVANFELGVLTPPSTGAPTPAPTPGPTDAPPRLGDSSVLVTVVIGTLALIGCIIAMSLLSMNSK